MNEGSIFAVVGASGVGKDSLLNEVRGRRPDLHIVRRAITRPARAGGEDFEAVSEAEFERRLAKGAFVLNWQAHGLRYGIPASVRDVLASGRDVVFNGSREHLLQAQEAFPNLVVISITASPKALAERLAARGRESAQSVAERLKRAALPLPGGLNRVIEIDNSGEFSAAVEAILAALQPVSG